MLVLFAVTSYALTRTAWGRHVYATGDDHEAARLSGIKVDRVLLSVYLVAGILYGLAAWILIGRVGVASTNNLTNANLDTITAVVIGGTSMFSGRAPSSARCRRPDVQTFQSGLITGRGTKPVPGAGGRHSRHRRRRARPVDQKGTPMTMDVDATSVNAGQPSKPAMSGTPTLETRGLVKTFGHVVGLANVSLKLYPGEVLAIIGDNGAGKSTLIKCLSGALTPDEGDILLDGHKVVFKSPTDARLASIETVFQTLAVPTPWTSPATSIWAGRCAARAWPEFFRKLDTRGMRESAKEQLSDLGIATIQDITQKVETLSGGQRQAVAVARAAAFGSKVVILDEPTAALGVKESGQVLALIKRLRDRGMPVILISHNMPQVFEVADRIHIQRLGRCAGVITPQSHTMEEAVAIMTGATMLDQSKSTGDESAGAS